MSDPTAAPTIGATLAGAPPVARSSRAGGRLGRVRWWTYLLLGVAALGSVFPLYWMFIVASTDSATATKLPPEILPGGNFFHLAGLVLDTVPFLQSIGNSLVIATTIGVGQALICALGGFAFAKLQFRGRNVLFLVVVLTMTVPTQLAVIPQYMIVSWLGWVDTLQAVAIPGLASAFGMFWMRQHIVTTINDELLQAARIDGASTWQIFWRIAFPIVRPAAFVLGLFGFVTSWNDFLWPYIVLKSPDRFTAQIAIKALQNSFTVDLGLAMSGSFLATLPLLVLFIFVGRKMVAGILDGAFKG